MVYKHAIEIESICVPFVQLDKWPLITKVALLCQVQCVIKELHPQLNQRDGFEDLHPLDILHQSKYHTIAQH